MFGVTGGLYYTMLCYAIDTVLVEIYCAKNVDNIMLKALGFFSSSHPFSSFPFRSCYYSLLLS